MEQLRRALPFKRDFSTASLQISRSIREQRSQRQGWGSKSLSFCCLLGKWVLDDWSRLIDGCCFPFLAAAVFRLAFLQAMKHLGCFWKCSVSPMRFLMCRVHTCSEHLAVFCQRGGMGGPPAASRASFCVCFWLLLLRDLWEAIVVERIKR